jgi:hypothetical protein
MIPAAARRTARAGHFALTDRPPSAEPGLAAVARWLTGVLRRTRGITLRTDLGRAAPDATVAAPRARRPGRRTDRGHRGPAYDLTSASGSATGSGSISRRA